MLRDSKRKSAVNLFAFPVMLSFDDSPSELCVLGRNSATSKICDRLPPPCCVMKQKQRDRWTCFIASGKAGAENLGQWGKYCLRNLGGFVLSWKEMELEPESRGFQRVRFPCCWLSACGWRGGHPLLDPNCSPELRSICRQPQTGRVSAWRSHLSCDGKVICVRESLSCTSCRTWSR